MENGLAVASVIWWPNWPSRAYPRMRSDARGYPWWPGAVCSAQGPDTEEQDQSLPLCRFSLQRTAGPYSWVIRDRGHVSSKSGYDRSAPKATELLRRHETTRWHISGSQRPLFENRCWRTLCAHRGAGPRTVKCRPVAPCVHTRPKAYTRRTLQEDRAAQSDVHTDRDIQRSTFRFCRLFATSA